MEESIRLVARRRPTLTTMLVKYLTFWFHSPFYNGVEGEIGGNQTIRFFTAIVS